MCTHFLALAIWAAAFAPRPRSCVAGLCHWVIVGGVAAVARPKGEAAATRLDEAETALRDAPELLPSIGVGVRRWISWPRSSDIELGRFVLGTHEQSKEKCRSAAAVARAFVRRPTCHPAHGAAAADDVGPLQRRMRPPMGSPHAAGARRVAEVLGSPQPVTRPAPLRSPELIWLPQPIRRPRGWRPRGPRSA